VDSKQQGGSLQRTAVAATFVDSKQRGGSLQCTAVAATLSDSHGSRKVAVQECIATFSGLYLSFRWTASFFGFSVAWWKNNDAT